jgi:hypothetical protein
VKDRLTRCSQKNLRHFIGPSNGGISQCETIVILLYPEMEIISFEECKIASLTNKCIDSMAVIAHSAFSEPLTIGWAVSATANRAIRMPLYDWISILRLA